MRTCVSTKQELFRWRSHGSGDSWSVNRIFLALCSRSQPLVSSHRLVSTVRCSLPKYVLLSTVTGRQFTMLALLLCGDIELNPGPSGDKYPRGYCGLNVTWSRPAVACDECIVWYHKSCYSMSDSKYDRLADEPWVCRKCETSNSSARTFHPYELEGRLPYWSTPKMPNFGVIWVSTYCMYYYRSHFFVKSLH